MTPAFNQDRVLSDEIIEIVGMKLLINNEIMKLLDCKQCINVKYGRNNVKHII